MTAPPRHDRPRSRRWFLLAGGGAVLALAGAGSAAAVFRGDDRQEPAGPAPRRTVKVTRTTLVEGQTFKGAVEYGEPAPLATRLAGTVTRLPATGQILRAGDPLCWLDNRPVILMTGDVPAYRDLGTGIKGPDVRQLEGNLKALGFGGFTVDETFSASTATAVKQWQKRVGLEQTGSVELGRVVFQPGQVRVGALKVRVGDQVSGGPIFEATSTERRVVMRLDAKYKTLVPPGGAATVLLPGGGTTAGTVKDVVEEGGDAVKLRVAVTVADQAAISAGDPTSVEVRVVVRERKDVLAVPIVALLALDGDRYGVEVVTGATARIVPVELGLFAAGNVEIRGAGIAEGTDVSVPTS
ncbi:peptidoglycan-binding domain-containing protein [Dactylosporangium sp. CA-139114]|uniref:peptidoglycan-binding domain-containing protein n=1 Tax=Dactylosporangium sp. CA-139114 TaxID=3239931 RepID=UPI003D9613EB